MGIPIPTAKNNLCSLKASHYSNIFLPCIFLGHGLYGLEGKWVRKTHASGTPVRDDIPNSSRHTPTPHDSSAVGVSGCPASPTRGPPNANRFKRSNWAYRWHVIRQATILSTPIVRGAGRLSRCGAIRLAANSTYIRCTMHGP